MAGSGDAEPLRRKGHEITSVKGVSARTFTHEQVSEHPVTIVCVVEPSLSQLFFIATVIIVRVLFIYACVSCVGLPLP